MAKIVQLNLHQPLINSPFYNGMGKWALKHFGENGYDIYVHLLDDFEITAQNYENEQPEYFARKLISNLLHSD